MYVCLEGGVGGVKSRPMRQTSSILDIEKKNPQVYQSETQFEFDLQGHLQIKLFFLMRTPIFILQKKKITKKRVNTNMILDHDTVTSKLVGILD